MTRRSRWLWVPPACLVAVALFCATAGAADKTKVEGAKFSGNTMGEFFKKTFGS